MNLEQQLPQFLVKLTNTNLILDMARKEGAMTVTLSCAPEAAH